MIACCCSSPVCMVNGCQQVAQLRKEYAAMPFERLSGAQPAPPALTPEDIRRIVREEIERSKGTP